MTKQLMIVFSICLAGNMLSEFLPLPVPGSVLAMLGLLGLLCVGIVEECSIAGLCDFFKDNMAFFFIPAGIGVAEHLNLMKESGLALLIVCVVGTFLTFVATVFTIKGVLMMQAKRRARK